GVDPKVGLYASFCIAVVIAFVGGRPGMISAATGAMALLMVTLVKEHGLQYLLAATILTGFIQILAGYLKLGALMRFVSKSVMGKHGNETEHDSSKIGTHIENVVRALHKPVLITSAPFSPPKSFLIAFDGSQTARK
ncbi:SulP family inorganic anion transporter, partial [Acinetobacter baumannii]|uniref:SulP family inorganic anion transporter n=1 Tax=Acinetobacter baumannii TaxID=470 RepID=UPI002265F01B